LYFLTSFIVQLAACAPEVLNLINLAHDSRTTHFEAVSFRVMVADFLSFSSEQLAGKLLKSNK